MSNEVVPVRKYRKAIPKEHQVSLDTRLAWLWMQRFGTVQTIWMESDDVLDKTACTTILQAVMGHDLGSIKLLFHRIEGGSQPDSAVAATRMRY